MAFGLSRLDVPDKELGIWPDNWDSLRVFEALSTQWRTGAFGATGLDYTAIPATASMLGIKRSELPDIFPDIRIMEIEALAVMAEATG
ncbi:Phage related hypothetical protein (DUF1799) [Pseudomonas asplenii]|uniref:Phage protein n=1 Tax=Pseudomonas asplenii TaxID=53407 RepID=A0A0M9GBM1_9PSED|nr:DUF1799 domain-containing protein [Pseudomonas fuscovaginae]KPA87070.1 Phage related hypothetical protein (DUF1799) [Pseudomonas fuscovaginae]